MKMAKMGLLLLLVPKKCNKFSLGLPRFLKNSSMDRGNHKKSHSSGDRTSRGGNGHSHEEEHGESRHIHSSSSYVKIGV